MYKRQEYERLSTYDVNAGKSQLEALKSQLKASKKEQGQACLLYTSVTEGMLYSNGEFKENPAAPGEKMNELENRVSATEDAVLA